MLHLALTFATSSAIHFDVKNIGSSDVYLILITMLVIELLLTYVIHNIFHR